MSISVTTRISGSLEVFSLPTSLESLQERGIVRDENDFLTNSTCSAKMDGGADNEP